MNTIFQNFTHSVGNRPGQLQLVEANHRIEFQEVPRISNIFLRVLRYLIQPLCRLLHALFGQKNNLVYSNRVIQLVENLKGCRSENKNWAAVTGNLQKLSTRRLSPQANTALTQFTDQLRAPSQQTVEKPSAPREPNFAEEIALSKAAIAQLPPWFDQTQAEVALPYPRDLPAYYERKANQKLSLRELFSRDLQYIETHLPPATKEECKKRCEQIAAMRKFMHFFPGSPSRPPFLNTFNGVQNPDGRQCYALSTAVFYAQVSFLYPFVRPLPNPLIDANFSEAEQDNLYFNQDAREKLSRKRNELLAFQQSFLALLQTLRNPEPSPSPSLSSTWGSTITFTDQLRAFTRSTLGENWLLFTPQGNGTYAYSSPGEDPIQRYRDILHSNWRALKFGQNGHYWVVIRDDQDALHYISDTVHGQGSMRGHFSVRDLENAPQLARHIYTHLLPHN